MSELLQELNAELVGVVAGVRRSLVQIQNGYHGGGAGTIWHPGGLILTSAHLAGRRNLRVIVPAVDAVPVHVVNAFLRRAVKST